MLEANFELPDREQSEKETQKRGELIDWFAEYIQNSVTGLLVTGSMSYGQSYSVKPSSDVDMQLLVNNETVKELLKTDCFNSDELRHAVEGYRSGLYGQFSLVFEKNGVPMECHFWDEQAFIEAITFKNENTKRLRSSIESPSTDFGYSFDREESRKDYYGEIIRGFAVADFPSFRNVNGKIFLCRPVTNILGLPLSVIKGPTLSDAIEECWKSATDKLIAFAGNDKIDLNNISIANTLPGKNKMSPESLEEVQTKTKLFIDSRN